MTLRGPIVSHMSVPATLDVPKGVRRGEIVVGGYRLATLETANSADQGSALLLPGLTGSKEDFLAILGPLHDLGWRVCAIDLLGQYESQGPEDVSAYQLATQVASLARVAESIGPPVHLVGHSMGGVLARAAAVTHPELFTSLTLLNSGPGPLEPTAQQLLQQLIAALDHLSPGQVQQFRAASATESFQPEIAAFLQRRWDLTRSAHLQALAALALDPPDLLPTLKEMLDSGVLRALVAYGGRDDESWSTDRYAQLARDLGCPAVVFPNAAHSPAVESPAETAAALHEFWSGESQ